MTWLSTQITGQGPKGKRIYSVLAKRTYCIQQKTLQYAPVQKPIVTGDVYADPNNLKYSEVLAESDCVAFKPTTDVIIIGKASAPRGKQAYSLVCEARIGPLGKSIVVYGERILLKKALSGLSFSEPKPFSVMEFSYTRAYGGVARSKTDAWVSFLPNPLGKGFAIKGGFKEISEITIPNLEDPASPVAPESMIVDKPEDFIRAPKPASFGWTRQDFYPRYTFLGGGPELIDGAAPAGSSFSSGFDPRFFQGASDGLWGKQLAGGESVMLKYFDPDNPVFQFALPREKPTMSADRGEGFHELAPVLQTVVIDMNEKVLTMLWRGGLEIAGIEEISRVEARVD